MGFNEDLDYLSSSEFDTRASYYNIKDDKIESISSSVPSTSMDQLRKFDTCNLNYEVYPNPTSQSIQLTIDKDPIRATLPVTIHDELGRIVLKAIGPTIVVEQLPAGTYFISVGNNANATPLVIAH